MVYVTVYAMVEEINLNTIVSGNIVCSDLRAAEMYRPATHEMGMGVYPALLYKTLDALWAICNHSTALHRFAVFLT